MARRRHTPEQIVRKLREADQLLVEGADVAEVARRLEVSEQTYHRWRNQFGGMKADDARRLRELERENAQLKRLVADKELENCLHRLETPEHRRNRPRAAARRADLDAVLPNASPGDPRLRPVPPRHDHPAPALRILRHRAHQPPGAHPGRHRPSLAWPAALPASPVAGRPHRAGRARPPHPRPCRPGFHRRGARPEAGRRPA